ncbi:MAG: hypothetical protein Q8P95_04435 [bacterium]|nr:hypothetical protein [bacterium]
MKKGYATPLFEERKAVWNDDRLFANDATETRYHDKEKCLKIVNGLCHDIFFRAKDIEKESFQNIPDFSAPVPPALKPVLRPERSTKNKRGKRKKAGTKKTNFTTDKPLDSRKKRRTYVKEEIL